MRVLVSNIILLKIIHGRKLADQSILRNSNNSHFCPEEETPEILHLTLGGLYVLKIPNFAFDEVSDYAHSMTVII